MTPITREQADAFLARWKLVKQAQTKELRETSIDTKVRQLSTLMASRDLFPPDPDRELQVEGVRERWARIHRAFDG
jgi:hypothetical protein